MGTIGTKYPLVSLIPLDFGHPCQTISNPLACSVICDFGKDPRLFCFVAAFGTQLRESFGTLQFEEQTAFIT